MKWGLVIFLSGLGAIGLIVLVLFVLLSISWLITGGLMNWLNPSDRNPLNEPFGDYHYPLPNTSSKEGERETMGLLGNG